MIAIVLLWPARPTRLYTCYTSCLFLIENENAAEQVLAEQLVDSQVNGMKDARLFHTV